MKAIFIKANKSVSKTNRAILKILGFSDDEANQLLDYLYPALAKEIEQLKTLMQG